MVRPNAYAVCMCIIDNDIPLHMFRALSVSRITLLSNPEPQKTFHSVHELQVCTRMTVRSGLACTNTASLPLDEPNGPQVYQLILQMDCKFASGLKHSFALFCNNEMQNRYQSVQSVVFSSLEHSVQHDIESGERNSSTE
jgi:hypothetical protein